MTKAIEDMKFIPVPTKWAVDLEISPEEWETFTRRIAPKIAALVAKWGLDFAIVDRPDGAMSIEISEGNETGKD